MTWLSDNYQYDTKKLIEAALNHSFVFLYMILIKSLHGYTTPPRIRGETPISKKKLKLYYFWLRDVQVLYLSAIVFNR